MTIANKILAIKRKHVELSQKIEKIIQHFIINSKK